MIRHVLVLAALLAAPVVLAQSDVHVFEIRDGQVYLDGRLLPNAVPDSLDLSGMGMQALQYSGPLTPVVKVGDQAFVLDGQRLVRFEESTQADQGVYIMGEPLPMFEAMPPEQLARASEAAYLRNVASRDQALFSKLQREQQLEIQGLQLAERIRSMPLGAERDRLKEDLRRQLAEIFRLKQEARRDELARAQEEIDRIRAVLDARDARRDAIVEHRLQELSGGQ